MGRRVIVLACWRKCSSAILSLESVEDCFVVYPVFILPHRDQKQLEGTELVMLHPVEPLLEQPQLRVTKDNRETFLAHSSPRSLVRGRTSFSHFHQLHV